MFHGSRFEKNLKNCATRIATIIARGRDDPEDGTLSDPYVTGDTVRWTNGDKRCQGTPCEAWQNYINGDCDGSHPGPLIVTDVFQWIRPKRGPLKLTRGPDTGKKRKRYVKRRSGGQVIRKPLEA